MIERELVITKPQRAFFLGALFSSAPKKALTTNVIDFSLFDNSQFNAQAMEKAFNCLLERNDGLRIHLGRKKGLLFYQQIEAFEWVSIEKHQIKDKAAFEEAVQEMPAPIPLMSNPLYRVKILECEDGTGGICMCFHHLLIDGYSIDLVCKRLDHYYQIFCKGEVPKEEKCFSVTKYAEMENQYVKSTQYKDDRKFWMHQFNHQPRYSFPVGRVPSIGISELIKFSLTGQEYLDLFDLCDRFSCSFTSMVMSISALTVFALTGNHNFCFFSLTHGRRNFILKQTIGNFYNNCPVFYDLPDDATIADCIAYCHQSYMEHMLHAQFPTANMTLITAKETHFKRFGYGHQWCMFSTLGFKDMAEQLSLEHMTSNFMPLFSIFYIAILNIPKQNRLDFAVYYHKKCFDADQLKKIFDAFKSTLNLVTKNLDKGLDFLLQK